MASIGILRGSCRHFHTCRLRSPDSIRRTRWWCRSFGSWPVLFGEAQRPPESGGQRGPIGSRGRRFPGKPCKEAALEPPLARSRLRLDRAALLTQEGVAVLLQTLCACFE